MPNRLAKVVGETFFEAKVMAQNKYGEDGFEVISSRRINKSVYCGFGQKQVIELTINVLPEDERMRRDAPVRPSTSVEITRNNQAFSNLSREPSKQRQDQNDCPQTTYDELLLRGVGENEPTKIYSRSMNKQPMRQVHGLRGNQEGSDFPKVQKIQSDDSDYDEQVDNLLERMLKVREERGSSSKHSIQRQRQPVGISKELTQDNMNDISRRLAELHEMLANMNKSSRQAVNIEVPEMPEGLCDVKKNLLAIETPVDVAEQVIFDIKDVLPVSALSMPDQARRTTVDWLRQKLKFAPEIEFNPSAEAKKIVLIGPTGVGKTTTIAKLAASYGLSMKQQKRVALLTLDTYRIGATEQLQQYAQIIDVDMEILFRPEDVDVAIEKHRDKDLIIVDTAGRCQKDSQELKELRKFVDRIDNPVKYLVLSATSKYTDMLDTVECFGQVGFEHLIFTKVDETNSVGPLLGLLYKTGSSLAYITNGQKVPEDFRRADFNFFDNRLFFRSPGQNNKTVGNLNSSSN